MKARIKRILKRTPRPLIYILGLVLLVYGLFASVMIFSYNDWGKSGSLGDTFGILNAFFTCIGTAGIIYTLFLQNKTFETSIKPLLEIISKGEEDGYFKLLVKNIGNGTAMNIEILPLKITTADDSPFKFKEINFQQSTNKTLNLQASAEDFVMIGAYDEKNKLLDKIFLSLIDEKVSDFTFEFEVIYIDVSNRGLKQTFKLGLNDGRITMIDY
ncbi:hypothetical protein KQ941_02765 [Paenibacillus xylanexedens]|uniref:hypothetical protein n=1 Tax=Paenibacillus xylanexedens TaxID=528191 RepID=UPI001F2AF8F0|nr:hypothetical protein [Paenibacillus xylanexedens]MCF7753351.1 hypothetical protein [Paenibacillus xylanexedens]